MLVSYIPRLHSIEKWGWAEATLVSCSFTLFLVSNIILLVPVVECDLILFSRPSLSVKV